MFFEYKRDLPQVERLIFNLLCPRDLVNAKQVCKDWAISVRRYLGQLDANRTSELMKMAFLEPLPSYVIVKVPTSFRDLTINNRKEIYILGDGKIMQLDSVNFQVKKTMMYELREDYLEKIESPENGYAYGNCLNIFVNKDGSQFLVQDPYHRSRRSCKIFEYRKCMSTPDILRYSLKGKTRTRMSYNAEMISTKILSDRKKLSQGDLLKVKTELKALYIIELSWDLYMYTAKNHKSEFHTLICVARMSTTGTFTVKNIANIKMFYLYVTLRVVGTRVFCYERGMFFTSAMEVVSTNYPPRNRIVVFDVWNPESVESDGNLTKSVLQKLH